MKNITNMENFEIFRKIRISSKFAALRFIVSVIFILSAIGKMQNPTSASQLIQSYTQISPNMGSSLMWTLIVVELFAAVLVFIPLLLRRFLYPLLSFVLILFISVFLSITKNVDCGCFGSLPLLSQLSPGAHILLLLGLFVGIYTLAMHAKNTQHKKSHIEEWLGLGALLVIIVALLSIPFSFITQALSFTNDTIVDISVVEAVIHDDSILLIDARPQFQYELGHLAGAINIPYDTKELANLIKQHSLVKKSLIVYCSSSRCNAAEILAKKMHDHGCNKLRIFPGGWEEWQRYNKKQIVKSL